MKATITVEMDNAAFSQPSGNGTELAHILSHLAGDVMMQDLQDGGTLTARDVNGNKVARLVITDD